jgi:aerobic-type carbon monoxide dehydrogenase small subunit (CoxS/CutS family)
VRINGVLRKSCALTLADVPLGARIESYEHLRHLPMVMRAVGFFGDERHSRCELCVGALGVCAASLQDTPESERRAAVESLVAEATCQCTGRASLRRSLIAAL